MRRPSSSRVAWIISSAFTPKSKSRAKIMAIAVHPYISGVPHRIKYFERVFETLKKQEGVLFWTGEQIMRWYERARRGDPAKPA